MTARGMHGRFLLPLLLALGCGPVLADWVKVSSNEKSVFYLDGNMPKKMDNHILIRVLRDHTGPQFDHAAPYLSTIDDLEIDCGEKRVRRSYTADFAQPMGAGRPVYFEHGPMSWNYPPPNTIFKRIMDIACARH